MALRFSLGMKCRGAPSGGADLESFTGKYNFIDAEKIQLFDDTDFDLSITMKSAGVEYFRPDLRVRDGDPKGGDARVTCPKQSVSAAPFLQVTCYRKNTARPASIASRARQNSYRHLHFRRI
ncbi:MAG: hypothetical protein LBR60_09410 [Fibrobacter sp.]|jgi:hypothetical protein|nr:hypothetical protein [Fibrobacter sp.]